MNQNIRYSNRVMDAKQANVSDQKDPDATYSSAVNPTRNLTFFTITAFVPMLLLTGALLLGITSRPALAVICLICFLVAGVGLGRLLYEILLDISGYPDYKLPVWSVLYLFSYIVNGFTAIYYYLDLKDGKKSFDKYYTALYHGIEGYLGQPYTGDQSHRYIAISQNILSAFVHAVIITKFVSAF